MNTITFDIAYPATKQGKVQWNKEYGMNAYYSGKHWLKRREDAEFWHWTTVVALRNSKQPVQMFEKPVVLTFLFNDDMDCSNHAAQVKMIEDALKGLILKDDSKKYVNGIFIGFHNLPVIRVTIMEANEYEKRIA